MTGAWVRSLPVLWDCAGSHAGLHPRAHIWSQPHLQRGTWMERAPLAGHVVPRAVLKQQAALADAGPPAPVSPLQDSDDVARINSMIEVGLACPLQRYRLRGWHGFMLLTFEGPGRVHVSAP